MTKRISNGVKLKKNLRTWIEIDVSALEHNLKVFLKLIPKRTRFMAVVKSNAYGHGLVQVAKQLAESGIWNSESGILNSKFPWPTADAVSGLGKILNSRLWFGVDSIVEALRLRKEGVKNPILVLGFTLPGMMFDAARNGISVSISNFESLADLAKAKEKPFFHLKFDTGMHRQGFLVGDSARVIRFLRSHHLSPQGIFTHFAAAKDIAYPTYTFEQLKQFKMITGRFERAGFKKMIKHSSASGGVLLFPETHLDMVRIGMGLYGYWPSPESRITNQGSQITLQPVLQWKTVVAETKEISKGSYVGYDLTERASRKTKIAVLPIGYWHGYDRGFSGIGEVIIRGRRRKLLGRVSMDMIVVDVTDNPRVKAGDTAVLIGEQEKEGVWADELALKISTSQYELLTRINPLIHRFFL